MRPLTLRSEIVIPADPAHVWSVLVDFRSWPRWCGPVERVASTPALAVGGRLAYVLRMAGGRVGFDVTVDRLVPEKRLCWSSTKWWGVRGSRCFVLDADPVGTRVEDHKTFESRFWPVSVAYPRSVVRRMSEAWLRDLRAEVIRRGTSTDVQS